MRGRAVESHSQGDLTGSAFVIGAAVLWGSLGIAARAATDAGISLHVASWWRAALATIGFSVLCVTIDRRLLRVRRRDLPLLAAYGFFSIALFYVAYFTAIERSSLATAAILLYTGPGWVLVLSAIFLGESWTRRKGVALALAFAGCALVARAYDFDALRSDRLGIAAGLAAGLFYGAYSIFAKRALRTYAALTVVTYGVFFGAIFLVPLGLAAGTPAAAYLLPASWQAWGPILYLALVATVGASGMYVSALTRIEAGRASILATIEPVVAAAFGLAFFREQLDAWQIVGGLLVLGAGWTITSWPRRAPANDP
ncbi:MAG: EamA family transporter [Armatimonadetes bacterium]|nr:EamA family transporter [Armatimonadota bacterium]